METWVTKVLVIFLMLVPSLAFGLVPIKLVTRLRASGRRSGATTQKVVSLLNCFAGGVFLATTFLHLLPEVQEGMAELLEAWSVTTSFPVAEFMVTAGMFVIMFIEHFVMMVQHHYGDVSFPSSDENSYSEEQQPLCDAKEEEDAEGKIKRRGKSYGSVWDESESGKAVWNKASTASTDKIEDADNKGHRSEQCEGRDRRVVGSRPEVGKVDAHTHAHAHKRDVVLAHAQDVVLEDGACVHVITPTHHQHHHVAPQQLGGIRSFLLLLAMSLHTIFEGLAIGLQPTSTSVWSLFLAVIIHKCVIAFSLGVQFAENLSHVTRAVIFILVFAFMSPFGAAIGTVLTETTHGSVSVDTASTILQGISTGVFLYVTFFEVLGREVGADHSLVKVCLILLGYGAIAVLQLLLPEPEDGH